MKLTSLIFICLLLCAGMAWAQDEEKDQTDDEETVTIPKSVFEQLLERVINLEKEVQDLKGQQPQVTTPPAVEQPQGAAAPAGGGGKALLLPDISFITQAKGKATSDNRDELRNRLRLTEAELAIQGYVYPQVKADGFIVMSPAEDAAAQVEEAYLSYLGAAKGLNVYVGKKHAAFGRSNLLHNHSWLYTRQPLVLSNLVAAESLGGEGLEASYLIPTNSNLFAQLSFGTWSAGEEGEQSDPPDIMAGPGANYTDRFNTARLWMSHPVGADGELELGGSYANGFSNAAEASRQEAGQSRSHIKLSGVDLSYRRFGARNKRLLLRGEHFWRQEKAGPDSSKAKGYYLLGNYRWNKYNDLGLLYDWSEFPQAPDIHESALSLIYTRQFQEQYYLRLQATHGARPGVSSYNELWLQWTWGVGPHTHNLE